MVIAAEADAGLELRPARQIERPSLTAFRFFFTETSSVKIRT
jgi:hypothetical protein